ncbi:MAG: c-type cytochrome [Gammaproteobacteria bacterium]|nr:c-type cytochrome [Gammaproteobacteria bacterium]MBV8404975.1 c-type cytochrome [Gammaproteobacteria bacterium]
MDFRPVMAGLAPLRSRGRLLRPTAALLILTGALLSCGQPHDAPATVSPAAPPAVTYESHLLAGEAPVPGASLTNPHAGDAAVARSGAALFTAMNCDGCHGTDGTGWVGPNLGDGRWRYGRADGEIFSSIYYGRPHGMPAFGAALGADGVWTLVTYLRTLPAPADVPTESWQD